jgi:hypothetical protein
MTPSPRASGAFRNGLAGQRHWREAWATLLRFMLPPGPSTCAQIALASFLLSLRPPADPSDLVITVEAEDQFSFQEQLARITTPTLCDKGHRSTGEVTTYETLARSSRPDSRRVGATR